MGVTGQSDSRPLWPYVPLHLGPREHGGLGEVELMYRNSDLQALERDVAPLEQLEQKLQADPVGITPKLLWYGLRHYRGDEGATHRYQLDEISDLPNGWLLSEGVQEALLAGLALAFGQDPGPMLEQARAARDRQLRLAELVAEGHSIEQATQLIADEQEGDPSPPAEAATGAA